MCGTLVRMRRCSSASLESGTARNRDSVVCSAAASRKPKMDGDEAGGDAAFPTDGAEEPHKKMAEERSAAEKSLMGSTVKVSKVAQVLVARASCPRVGVWLQFEVSTGRARRHPKELHTDQVLRP